MKYTQENNIVTCENGHGYSFHTDQAQELKLSGICRICDREAHDIVDMQLEVSLPYGIHMQGSMDDAAVKLLGAEILEVLKPIMLNKVVNPEYKGDLRLREEHKGVVEDLSILKDQHKKLLAEQNEALRLLWSFCDEINKKPRHGNVFELAKDALVKIRDESHLLGELAVADNAVRIELKHADEAFSLQKNQLNKDHCAWCKRAWQANWEKQ